MPIILSLAQTGHHGGFTLGAVGWLRRVFGRRRGTGGTPAPGRSDGPGMDIDLDAVRRYAREFVATHRGVEAYVEPATHVSPTTVVFIAHDGKWTRRAVGSPKAGFALGRELGIPVYDVNLTGYPSRMREWSRRQRRRG